MRNNNSKFSEIQRQIHAGKEAFRLWKAGDQNQCYVLKRHPDYSVCKILFPNWISDLKFNLRYVIMSIIRKLPHSSIKVWLYRLMGVRIGRNVYIAPDVFIDAFYPRLIEIEDNCFLGIGCRLLTHEYTADYFRAGRIHVCKGSVVGAWSIIRCGVTLGERVTTGFGSVVVKDVLDNTTVGGVPAQPLKSIKGSI
jgi:acetyltransferase-like isoleucine patch superfamily enzyme